VGVVKWGTRSAFSIEFIARAFAIISRAVDAPSAPPRSSDEYPPTFVSLPGQSRWQGPAYNTSWRSVGPPNLSSLTVSRGVLRCGGGGVRVWGKWFPFRPTNETPASLGASGEMVSRLVSRCGKVIRRLLGDLSMFCAIVLGSSPGLYRSPVDREIISHETNKKQPALTNDKIGQALEPATAGSVASRTPRRSR
jgi:hypothetical protein